MNTTKTILKLKTQVNSGLERHPVPILGIDYKVKMTYKNVKFIQVDVAEKVINISLPNKYKKMANSEVLDLAIEKLYEQVANTEIERAMEKTRVMLGFAPEEYEIVKMRVMGKCENSKIMIDPDVVKYTRDLIDYVVLHQYCHLKFKTHSKGFYKLIAEYEPDYKTYEKILKEI
jgi:predicted metal-dependent hydrolase